MLKRFAECPNTGGCEGINRSDHGHGYNSVILISMRANEASRCSPRLHYDNDYVVIIIIQGGAKELADFERARPLRQAFAFKLPTRNNGAIKPPDKMQRRP
jgi:hypothetical protein